MPLQLTRQAPRTWRCIPSELLAVVAEFAGTGRFIMLVVWPQTCLGTAKVRGTEALFLSAFEQHASLVVRDVPSALGHKVLRAHLPSVATCVFRACMSFADLQTITLRKCHFVDIRFCQGLTRLSSLVHLSLERMRLSQACLREIQKLTKLQTLSLEGSHFHWHWSYIFSFPSLITLDLDNTVAEMTLNESLTPLEYTDPRSVTHPHVLRVLKVRTCFVEEEMLFLLFSRLQSLSLSVYSFVRTYDYLIGADTLQELYLTGTDFNFRMEALQGLPRLKKVHVIGMYCVRWDSFPPNLEELHVQRVKRFKGVCTLARLRKLVIKNGDTATPKLAWDALQFLTHLTINDVWVKKLDLQQLLHKNTLQYFCLEQVSLPSKASYPLNLSADVLVMASVIRDGAQITTDDETISGILERVSCLQLRGVKNNEKKRLLNVHEKWVNKLQFV